MLGVESLTFTQDWIVFSLHFTKSVWTGSERTAYNIHLCNMVNYVGGLKNGPIIMRLLFNILEHFHLLKTIP